MTNSMTQWVKELRDAAMRVNDARRSENSGFAAGSGRAAASTDAAEAHFASLWAQRSDYREGIRLVVELALDADRRVLDERRRAEHAEALEAKRRALAPHGSCACSYDPPDDHCMHHSPKVLALKAALRELLSGHDNLYVAHFGPDSDPRDDIATHAARRFLDSSPAPITPTGDHLNEG